MEWDVQIDEQILMKVGRLFTPACQELGYTILANGADRHGSYVWEAGKAGELNRFITLGVTPTRHTDHGQEYVYGVSYTVESSTCFTRSVTEDGTAVVTDISGLITHGPLFDFAAPLERAATMADHINADQLTESFVIPRPPGTVSTSR